jgi:glutamate formiminotransferase
MGAVIEALSIALHQIAEGSRLERAEARRPELVEGKEVVSLQTASGPQTKRSIISLASNPVDIEAACFNKRSSKRRTRE